MTNTALEFPCEFSIKVFCNVGVDIEPTIVEILSNNKVQIEQVKISSRGSSGGKYNAYTATFIAEHKDQLDNIYRGLSSNSQIIMVL